jgi:fumarate reductase (CoM/CoB) subunit A
VLESLQVDVVVAGGGVGGLMAAYRAMRCGARVLLLGGSAGASNRISSLNTALHYAGPDSAAGLFDDMVRAGGAVNDLHVVAALAARIGRETEALDAMGVPFVRDGARLARRQAAGSSWTRAVFSQGMIGVDISRRLADEIEAAGDPATMHVRGGLLVELLTVDGRVAGVLAYSVRDERWIQVTAPAVVLATGGAGQLFDTTTNPRGSRGIGYAAALDAGALLSDMEFVSFEPFVTSAPEHARGHDLPTTVLREGARLLNGRGEEFLDTASAPTKDIICRAMVREVLEGRGTPSGSVYYDLSGMEPSAVERYVQIAQAFRGVPEAEAERRLEVMPAQHYLMGGVKIDKSAATSLAGLFAVGEVAAGAHGGHRLAAGGGLEVVAGGAIAGESAAGYALGRKGERDRPPAASPAPELLGQRLTAESKADLATIRSALSDGCGILRHGTNLTTSVAAIRDVLERARNRSDPFIRRCGLVALAVAESALARAESRADHYRTDHPDRDDVNWLGNLVITLDEDDDLSRRFQPVGCAHPVRT